MRRLSAWLWALWLLLAPLAAVWASVCTCTPAERLACCAQQAPTVCCPTNASECCAHSGAKCPDCPACTLEQANPVPSALSARVVLEWVDWVVDAPTPAVSIDFVLPRPAYGLPAVRNHSPPLSARAPRAPPLC
ncbi:MAG: hypothetical protein RMK45_01750 [Armatimonadota bacterium]|nr:hypothetical protein [Armatimonadota bacterium]